MQLGKDGARFRHGARAIGLELVPVGRKPKHRARVAGTESADDEVVNSSVFSNTIKDVSS